jgi:cell wall-associated NlpC family hydrolase
MGIKISFIILALLISFSVQSKNRESDPESDKSVSTQISFCRADVILFAKKLLGTPYRFASSSPLKGFDCSGFVNYVYKNFKISLPRSSVGFGALSAGLKPAEFKVGDVLVFYGFKNKTRVGHVGIICEAAGMNSRFIHSSSGKAQGVIISNLSSSMYTRRFYKCVDVIN